MLDSSLLFPDLPAWKTASSYSPRVAQVLTQAYGHLRNSPQRLDSFAAVHQMVIDHLSELMSARQRMHAFFLLGSACMAVYEPALALEYFGEALEISALDLQDARATADLAYLHATAHSWLSEYRASVDDLFDVLDILHALGEYATCPRTRSFELTVLGRLASAQFILANYDEAAHYLSEAYPLLEYRERNVAGAGTIEWIWAMIHRWQGRTPEALQRALVAVGFYEAADAPNSYGRIQAVTAEIMLDQAEFFGSGDAHSAYLTMADPYVERAVALARESHDVLGECLALLTRTRLSRLQMRNEDRTLAIERIIKIGERVGDKPIVAQALTALGHELTSNGDISSGLCCYHRAVRLALESEAPAVGRWAERELLRHQESHDGS
jgi:tetratricopeptide (TPR) repeat protein